MNTCTPDDHFEALQGLALSQRNNEEDIQDQTLPLHIKILSGKVFMLGVFYECHKMLPSRYGTTIANITMQQVWI